MARNLAGPLSSMAAEETFSGICQSADEVTTWLTTDAYADLVSGSAFKASDLASGNVTVFVQISLAELLVSPAVGRTIIGALLNAVFQANGKIIKAGRKVSDKVLFLLDEAAQLGRMSVIEQARDTGRKYGIVLQLLYQSLGQLEEVWERAGKRAWYDGTSWRAFAALSDDDTAEEVSKACGHHSVLAYSEGQNSGTSSSTAANGGRSRGQNTNVHEIKRRLITPEELTQDARKDELFVIGAGGKPIRCGRALYYRRSEMAALLSEDGTP